MEAYDENEITKQNEISKKEIELRQSEIDEFKEKELFTVQYLRQHGLKALVSKYKLKAKRHKKFSNLIQLKYNQTRSPFSSNIVKECRGLILDEKFNWKVVAYPYKKFFNYMEKYACEIDWNSAVVYEKLDGSLATLYWYHDDWYVASSSIPDATGTFVESTSFQEVFWDIWDKMNYKFPKNRNICYIFELITPKNVIVVRPEKETLILHGCRDIRKYPYQELDPIVTSKENGWQCVQVFGLKTLKEIINASNKLNPMVSEGFVVRDKNFNRIKVKSPQYVAIAHLSTDKGIQLTLKELVQIIRTNEGDEFLNYFPIYSKAHGCVKQIFERVVHRMHELVKQLKQVSPNVSTNTIYTQMKVSELEKNIISEFMKSEHDSIRDWFSECKIQSLVDLILANQNEEEKLIISHFQSQIKKKVKKKKKSNAPITKGGTSEELVFQIQEPNDQDDLESRIQVKSKKKKKKMLNSVAENNPQPKKKKKNKKTFKLDQIDLHVLVKELEKK